MQRIASRTFLRRRYWQILLLLLLLLFFVSFLVIATAIFSRYACCSWCTAGHDQERGGLCVGLLFQFVSKKSTRNDFVFFIQNVVDTKRLTSTFCANKKKERATSACDRTQQQATANPTQYKGQTNKTNNLLKIINQSSLSLPHQNEHIHHYWRYFAFNERVHYSVENIHAKTMQRFIALLLCCLLLLVFIAIYWQYIIVDLYCIVWIILHYCFFFFFCIVVNIVCIVLYCFFCWLLLLLLLRYYFVVLLLLYYYVVVWHKQTKKQTNLSKRKVIVDKQRQNSAGNNDKPHSKIILALVVRVVVLKPHQVHDCTRWNDEYHLHHPEIQRGKVVEKVEIATYEYQSVQKLRLERYS